MPIATVLTTGARSPPGPMPSGWIAQDNVPEMDYAVIFTIHPDVSGRPHVLLMLERLIDHINGHEGIRWATFDEIADDFAARSPRDGGAR